MDKIKMMANPQLSNIYLSILSNSINGLDNKDRTAAAHSKYVIDFSDRVFNHTVGVLGLESGYEKSIEEFMASAQEKFKDMFGDSDTQQDVD